MNKYLSILWLLVVGTFLPLSVSAQHLDNEVDAELMTERYTRSYDSLLNSYYLRRYAHRNLRHSQSFDVDEFDRLPDSLLISRLAALHTVVPMNYNDEVRSYIRFYLKHMSRRLDVMLTLCEYYHPLFEEVLDRYDVPNELKYLTIVESAMNPTAVSRVGASGLWQFMYSTGKLYDLEVNSVLDERRDPFKSTIAAARYLHDLYGIFNDWTLAIAAYNCGPGNINKAISRSAGKRDFWSIYYNLPRETRGYIPALIAVTYVMNYHEQHGILPTRLSLPVRTDTVMIHRDLLFCHLSQVVGIDIEELRTLNPQYRIDYIPASSAPYSLCLPLSKIEPFISLQDSIFTLTADSLARRPIKVQPAKASTSSRSSGSKYYTVRKGDTLSKIASKHGITVATLKKRNGLKNDKISVGQRLRIR